MKNTLDTNRNNKNKKDINYWKILNTAVTLDIQKGHLSWTMTQLSKKCGISRPLIYYYFGSSKITLLQEAIGTIGHELAGMSKSRIDLWKEGKIAESFLKTREILKDNPALVHFYIFNRCLNNELGKTIVASENKFRLKIARFFPGLDPITYESIFALFFGIVWVDTIPNQAVHRALEIILLGLNPKKS